MIYIRSIFEDGDIWGVFLQRRLNGGRGNGKRRAGHTPPLCGTPLVEGRETESGERKTENGTHPAAVLPRTNQLYATHPAALRHPSSRGEGNGERKTENGERDTPRRCIATHKSALRDTGACTPSPRGEGNGERERSLTY